MDLLLFGRFSIFYVQWNHQIIGDSSTTNEEVIQKAHDEFALRGLSYYTVEEYLGALHIFLRYYENCPLETVGEYSTKLRLGKHPVV